MVRESELKSIRRFVSGQLRAEQDLSSLTLGILKRRYLAKVGGDTLSASAKSLLKQVVEQELIKMQENKSGGESEAEDAQNKRKRENDTASESENEVASKRIKSSCRVSPESESEDEESNSPESAGNEEEEHSKTGSEDEKQEMRKSPEKKNGKCEEHSEDGETEMKTNMAKKKTDQSDDEDESNSSKSDSSQSSEESEKEENVVAEKKKDQADSDSSSLPSLEDEHEPKTKEKKVNKTNEKDQDGEKTKSTKKDKVGAPKKQKEDDKAVVRLKRYIALCGERRNYKKLLGECRSVRSMVAVLKKELEDLGVHGQPSIGKCKKVRLKKEEARELAELDVSNIIDSQGRPKRRRAFAQQQQHESPLHTLQRPLSTVSDSEEENNVRQVHRRASNWANLKGIISDDADSD